LLGFSLFDMQSKTSAQPPESIKKQLQISPEIGNDFDAHFRLLPAEEDQESGNAVPVLLRMVYEQQPFMGDVYPKLHEFAEMDIDDPRFKIFTLIVLQS